MNEIIETTPELCHVEAIDAKCLHCIKLNQEIMSADRSCPECGDRASGWEYCPSDGTKMTPLPEVCPAEEGKCPLQDVSAYYKVEE